MDMYLTAADFAGSGLIPYISAICTAIPQFFAITFFVLWIVMSAGSYFTVLKTSGKKRFWQTFLAISFVCFICTTVLAAMNGINDIIFLSGYWVAFYLLWVVFGWILLEAYK